MSQTTDNIEAVTAEAVLTATIDGKFPLGEVVITRNAHNQLNPTAISDALRRHASGDWGELCEDDQNQNELCLEQGCRLFSAYGSGDGRFWIITEADRSVTTVLLPEDY